MARTESGGKQGRTAARSARPKLRGLSDLFTFARSSKTPVYFVSPTAYNVLGIDQWVGAFEYVTYFDSFDGHHPHVFVPRSEEPQDFQSFESVNTYLLGHKQVIDRIYARGGGKVLFVMFEAETEELARELGLEVALPPRALREHVDSKIATTQLADEAGIASAPNVLGRAASYEELLDRAERAGLGRDLVVQTPYGDSGRTTFFVSTREQWDACEDKVVDEELKIMRRIEHLPGTVEACATRHGTLVGPIQTDITGFSELTPYRGGWCGNDVFPGVFDKRTRGAIRTMAARLGDTLYAHGYRGVFCVDFLVETGTGEVYLGEINPRISGASPLTNLLTSKYGGVPLFLFHLLEFMDVEWDIDLKKLQKRWEAYDEWSQLVLKQTEDVVELITEAPSTGLWQMNADGQVEFVRLVTTWHTVGHDDEAFYLRVYGAGEYRYKGGDMGVIVTRGRMQTDDRQLTDRAVRWAQGITSLFKGTPVDGPLPVPEPIYTKWF
jgi:biotin carboxylase